MLLAGAAVVLLAAWWLLRPRADASGEAAPVPAVAAETATATVTTFAVTIRALGTVAPRPGHSAQIAAPAATRVTRVYVGLGDRVRAGEPLVALDGSIWAAQIAQARASSTTAQQAYDRAARLVDQGILPRKDAEVARADLAATRAALTEAERTAALGTLRSPIDGVVTRIGAALSQPVDANQPLVEIVDPTGLEVLFHLAPDEAARVSEGAAVRFETDADSAAAPVGTGTVRGVSAAVDSTGAVPVRATVTAPARLLRVGETVAGSIIVAEHPAAIVVPASALVPGDAGPRLFVVGADGVAHATPVTVGARDRDRVEITAGLRGGETVVVSGAYGIEDGTRIRTAAAAGGAP